MRRCIDRFSRTATSVLARYSVVCITITFESRFSVHTGLMSYATDLAEQYQQAATYVDRILRGEKPADLPVQAPTKFETVVNLKTAKALGLTVPPGILVGTDEVIE